MITRELPLSVEVGRREFEIDADFRTMISVEDIIFSERVTERQREFAQEIMEFSDMDHDAACLNARYFEAMDLFYKGNIPDDLAEAADKMLWFYSCGEEEKNGRRKKKPVISLKHDFDYINAGFLQDYRMDLFEIKFLHWWKFMSLLSALHDNCRICEIIGWRGADLTKLDKEQRRKVREMQKLYALPDEISEEEKKRQDAVVEALLNGGDVSKALKGLE